MIDKKKKLVVIVSSTGGPKALHHVIPKLSKNLGAPVIVIQHMPKGFTLSFAKRLNEGSALVVKEAKDGEILKNGHVYIARGGYHMYLKENIEGMVCIQESEDAPVNGLRPCADLTFHSLFECTYDLVICVVLTGMGMDGCVGIEYLKKKHNVYTIAQNKETCVVYGMPKAIVDQGMADIVLPLDEIARTINIKMGVH